MSLFYATLLQQLRQESIDQHEESQRVWDQSSCEMNDIIKTAEREKEVSERDIAIELGVINAKIAAVATAEADIDTMTKNKKAKEDKRETVLTQRAEQNQVYNAERAELFKQIQGLNEAYYVLHDTQEGVKTAHEQSLLQKKIEPNEGKTRSIIYNIRFHYRTKSIDAYNM